MASAEIMTQPPSPTATKAPWPKVMLRRPSPGFGQGAQFQPSREMATVLQWVNANRTPLQDVTLLKQSWALGSRGCQVRPSEEHKMVLRPPTTIQTAPSQTTPDRQPPRAGGCSIGTTSKVADRVSAPTKATNPNKSNSNRRVDI